MRRGPETACPVGTVLERRRRATTGKTTDEMCHPLDNSFRCWTLQEGKWPEDQRVIMRHYFAAVLEELESALLVAPLRRAREKVPTPFAPIAHVHCFAPNPSFWQ